MVSINNDKTITVLLATYNGEKYLREQLDSIYAQDADINIKVFVSDDGSSDGTLDILKEYKGKYGLEYSVRDKNEKRAVNPKLDKELQSGAWSNFMRLIRLAPESDYYAFSDQDDVWLSNKISTAVEQISNHSDIVLGYDSRGGSYEKEKPVVYYCNPITVDEDLKEIYRERVDTKDPVKYLHYTDLYSTVVHNKCQGCACVMNKALMDKLKMVSPDTFIMFDWFTVTACLALGGTAIFDKRAFFLYRQHGTNVMGDKRAFISMLGIRAKYFFNKPDHRRQYMCKNVLKTYGKEIPRMNRLILKEVVQYRKDFSHKLALLFDRGFYHDGLNYAVSFAVAVILGKI